ncbi:hypothetical protein HYT56_03520 [Candidatus Woesearchaeota archaeon]|nr:hypothetical protein [Candidatus Woesearchaeota archaeon]
MKIVCLSARGDDSLEPFSSNAFVPLIKDYNFVICEKCCENRLSFRSV